MRALVAEIRGDKAAVLDREGIVRIIPNRQYRVGQEIEVAGSMILESVDGTGKKTRHLWRYFGLPAAAALTMVIGVSGRTLAYMVPCNTVTLDINPSLSYSLNAFEDVLEVSSYNEDGDALVTAISESVKGKKIGEAVAITLNELEEEDFISEEETPVVITVNSRFSAESRLEEEISGSLEAWNTEHSAKEDEETGYSVDTTLIAVSAAQLKEADDRKESPGKAYLEEKQEEFQGRKEAAADKAEGGKGQAEADENADGPAGGAGGDQMPGADTAGNSAGAAAGGSENGKADGALAGPGTSGNTAAGPGNVSGAGTPAAGTSAAGTGSGGTGNPAAGTDGADGGQAGGAGEGAGASGQAAAGGGAGMNNNAGNGAGMPGGNGQEGQAGGAGAGPGGPG